MTSKFNCLLVGESGVGKTPLVATLAGCEKTSPCLLLDVDAGAMSVVDNPKPTIYEVDSWSDVQRVYGLLKRQEWDVLAELTKSARLEYKSVVIDSGTELEYVLRRFVMSEGSDNEIPEQKHYLKTQERFRRLYRAFRDLPLTLVMTAGVRDLKDELAGIVKYYPAFQPALTRDLIRMTDLVLFMDVKFEDKRWIRTLQTHISQRVIARDRSQKLESIMKGEKLYMKNIVEKVLV